MNNPTENNKNDKTKKSCCGISERLEDKKNGKAGKGMMQSCQKAFRWMPLLPITLGIGFGTIGDYLNPETTRILWMIGAGMITTMGLFGILMAAKFQGKTNMPSCC